MAKLTSAEANELRRYLKRKKDQAKFVYSGKSEEDVLADLRKSNPDYDKACKTLDRAGNELRKLGFRGPYRYRGEYSPLNLADSVRFPDAIDKAVNDATDARQRDKNASESKFWADVEAAYETALDNITVARIDGNIDAATIIAAFELALSA